jgi:hypothetical protein
MAIFNPLISPNHGGLIEAGGHPQTPGRKNPAPILKKINNGDTNNLLYFRTFI